MPFSEVDRQGGGLLQHLARRLSIRRVLLILVVIALLPLGVLGFLQALAQVDREKANVRRQLTESVLLGALAEQKLLESAMSVTRMLASEPEIDRGPVARCEEYLRRISAQFEVITNLSVFGPNARYLCGSATIEAGGPVPDELWSRLRSGEAVLISGPVWGQLSQRQVVWILHPIKGAEGELTGAIGASVDLSLLANLLNGRHVDGDGVDLILDQNGRVVASSRPIDWARLAVSAPGEIVTVRDSAGRKWSYGSAPLVNDPATGQVLLHTVHALPNSQLIGEEWLFFVSFFALPLLALLFASIAIWLGANWAILRWITDLRALAEEYTRGNYRARVDAFAEAPREVRDLAASLYRMGRTIDTRDRLLTEAVETQMSLAREIHHRIKNNLQIIISMLALQARALHDPAGQQALDGARLRVAALALVHRLVYESGELAAVSTRRLFLELIAVLRQHFSTRSGVDIQYELADVLIDIDTAVPLSLWLVEAVSPAYTEGSGSGTIRIELRLHGDEGLILTASSGGGAGAVAGPGAGSRLLAAIARQLGGVLSHIPHPDDEERLGVMLAIPIRRPLPGTKEGRVGS